MPVNLDSYQSVPEKKEKNVFFINLLLIRKYPLHGYILGVLMHTTAWDQLWGGDYTLKGFSI